MEFLAEYGLFLAKTLTFVVAIVVVVAVVAGLSQRNKRPDKGYIEVRQLNDYFSDMRESLFDMLLDEDTLKQRAKTEKEKEKAKQKARKKALKEQAEKDKQAKKNTVSSEAQSGVKADDGSAEEQHVEAEQRKKRLFVLDFDGDIKASAAENLRQAITAVLTVAKPQDEVVVRLESGGGMVHSYGLAASQLDRITQRDIPLTVCVDKVAASGGYMMACVADKLVAAPFAILGSIGVVAQVPNIHRLLKKNDVDVEVLTAGKYKRTLTMMGENTDEGRKKFVEDLEDTHVLFKDYVAKRRPALNIEEVTTGEIWFGSQAIENNLADEISTSDEYVSSQAETADIYEVEYVLKKSLPEKLGMAAEGSADRLLTSWWTRLVSNRFPS